MVELAFLLFIAIVMLYTAKYSIWLVYPMAIALTILTLIIDPSYIWIVPIAIVMAICIRVYDYAYEKGYRDAIKAIKENVYNDRGE